MALRASRGKSLSQRCLSRPYYTEKPQRGKRLSQSNAGCLIEDITDRLIPKLNLSGFKQVVNAGGQLVVVQLVGVLIEFLRALEAVGRFRAIP